MDWNPKELVAWEKARLLSRPDLETREMKGHKVPQRIGKGEFSIEQNGEVRKIVIGHHYWDKAVEQFADIQGDVVDVIFLPYPWSIGGRRGIQYYFYKINETTS
jgi:hypothetical protein